MMKIPRPFAIGDEVRVVKSDSWFCKVGDQGLITKVEWSPTWKTFEYFMDGSGWYRHDCFKLVKKATFTSMKKALIRGGLDVV